MLKDQSQLYSCGLGQKQKVSQHCLTPSQSYNSHTQYLLQLVHLYFDAFKYSFTQILHETSKVICAVIMILMTTDKCDVVREFSLT